MNHQAEKIAGLGYTLPLKDLVAWLDLHEAMLSKENYKDTKSGSLMEILETKINRASKRFKGNYEEALNFIRQVYPSLEDSLEFDRGQIQENLAQLIDGASDKPAKLSNGNWLYRDLIYSTDGSLSDEQSTLVVMEAFDSERRYWERLKVKHLRDTEGIESHSRERIPEKVRIEVWRRDGGKCARCGSRERLEYDHIIPVSKGGGNSARNIELLCEKCNRSKSADIG